MKITQQPRHAARGSTVLRHDAQGDHLHGHVDQVQGGRDPSSHGCHLALLGARSSRSVGEERPRLRERLDHIGADSGRPLHAVHVRTCLRRSEPTVGSQSPERRNRPWESCADARDDEDVRRFRMREKLASIGDDFWIEDEDGDRAYRVNGKAVRVRDTFVLEDTSGNEVAKIQERKLSVRDKIAIERDGQRSPRCTRRWSASGTASRSTWKAARPQGPRQHRRPRVRDRARRRHGRAISKRGSASGTPTASRSTQARTRRCCWRPSSPSSR